MAASISSGGTALEVLTACGYDVHVLPIVGAGASFLSKGMVEAAKRHARKMLGLLDQADPTREASIVGVEPPEVYLLKHDTIDLLPDRVDDIRSLEARVWSIDEFLVRSEEFKSIVNLNSAKCLDHDGGRLLRRSAPRNDKLFFHPHCHQRAEGLAVDGMPSGANASVELLRACGYEVELSDAGCCGLAGTFGFEAEHYELSMRIGGLRLTPTLPPPNTTRKTMNTDSKYASSDLPPSFHFGDAARGEVSLRSGAEGVGIVSSGAACRMQIRHAAGSEARHPIEWVRDALVREG